MNVKVCLDWMIGGMIGPTRADIYGEPTKKCQYIILQTSRWPQGETFTDFIIRLVSLKSLYLALDPLWFKFLWAVTPFCLSSVIVLQLPSHFSFILPQFQQQSVMPVTRLGHQENSQWPGMLIGPQCQASVKKLNKIGKSKREQQKRSPLELLTASTPACLEPLP